MLYLQCTGDAAMAEKSDGSSRVLPDDSKNSFTNLFVCVCSAYPHTGVIAVLNACITV